MKKLNRVNLSHFRNDELLDFCQNVSQCIGRVAPIAGLTTMTDLALAVQDMKAASDSVIEAEYDDITSADNAVDIAWRCIDLLLRVARNDPRESVRDAAQRLSEPLAQFGNPTQLPYHEEYPRILDLLLAYENIPIEVQHEAGIDFWTAELRRRYDAFMQLYEKRLSEAARKVTGVVKVARNALETAYRNLYDSLNVLPLIDPSIELDQLIDDINEVIDTTPAAHR